MKKLLKDLNLLDKFLFDQTMDIPEAHEAVLQIIFDNEQLKLMTPAQTEKELRIMPWLRSVRLDVFSIDREYNVYDTEMQAGYRNDLAKRSRYYQGLIDSSLLEPGEVSFNKLANVYVIMIMPFDLFGERKYCYTFRQYCEENKQLRLNDGGARIFLNTKGTNDSEVSQELIDFLHYIENTDGTFAEQSGSKRIQKIHACVNKIKSSEEMGVKYMQSWEEKVIEREQGRVEGANQKLIGQVCRKLRKGKPIEQIAEELEEDVSIIQQIYQVAMEFSPEFDSEKIFAFWQKQI